MYGKSGQRRAVMGTVGAGWERGLLLLGAGTQPETLSVQLITNPDEGNGTFNNAPRINGKSFTDCFSASAGKIVSL